MFFTLVIREKVYVKRRAIKKVGWATSIDETPRQQI